MEAADLTNIVLLSGGDNGGPFWIGTRQPASLQEAPHALYFWTGPDYLKTMGIPLLQGRFFTPADRIGSDKVVVIDSVLANRFFPDQNPVGHRRLRSRIGERPASSAWLDTCATGVWTIPAPTFPSRFISRCINCRIRWSPTSSALSK